MFILSVYVSGREQPVHMNFKRAEDARRASEGGEGPRWRAKDDYGHEAEFVRELVVGCFITDIGREADLQVEQAVLQAEASAKAQTKIGNSPIVKLAGGIGRLGPGFSM